MQRLLIREIIIPFEMSAGLVLFLIYSSRTSRPVSLELVLVSQCLRFFTGNTTVEK